ncbi:MAG: DUF2291 domain-containing protein [Alphaproteobacteria bacterium]|nr:DUF2291 domain-containing protein [Alphaproteobacteria bacterium]
MKRTCSSLLFAVLALGVSSCTIVENAPPDQQAIPADASGDDARTAIRIKETFDSQLIPFVRENALPISELRAALEGGLVPTGEKHGHVGSGEGAAWNFPISGTGKVVAANLDSRARSMEIDTDDDGAADVTVQLGPVIKGSALRDVAPFYIYDDFRDQIEFAKLSRAINGKISEIIAVPEEEVVGKTATFVGAIALKSATEAFVVTAISVEFAQ